MDRREFLKTGPIVGAAAVTAAAGSPVPLQPIEPPIVSHASAALSVPPAPPQQRVYVLGGFPDGKGRVSDTIVQMCASVFQRLIDPLEAEGCQFFVTTGDVLGMTERIEGRKMRQLTTNYNTHYKVSMHEAVTGEFPLEDFIEKTSRWVPGRVLDEAGHSKLTARDAFAQGATRGLVGMPVLPQGVTYAAHYIDTVTGMVMRAVAIYEIATEDILLRFDVLVS